MVIQGLNTAASAYVTTYKPSNERQTSPAPAASSADKVTLSGVGKALAANASNATRPRTPAQENLLRAANSDRASAEKIAKGMAETPSAIAWDIRGVGGAEEVRKLATNGKAVDDGYIKSFKNAASLIDAQRHAIYETETRKGTEPLVILSKMIDFTNSQPQQYLEATGWGYQGSNPPA